MKMYHSSGSRDPGSMFIVPGKVPATRKVLHQNSCIPQNGYPMNDPGAGFCKYGASDDVNRIGSYNAATKQFEV